MTGVGFSFDDRFVATDSKDFTVKLLDAATGQLCTTCNGHQRKVVRRVFSHIVNVCRAPLRVVLTVGLLRYAEPIEVLRCEFNGDTMRKALDITYALAFLPIMTGSAIIMSGELASSRPPLSDGWRETAFFSFNFGYLGIYLLIGRYLDRFEKAPESEDD